MLVKENLVKTLESYVDFPELDRTVFINPYQAQRACSTKNGEKNNG